MIDEYARKQIAEFLDMVRDRGIRAIKIEHEGMSLDVVFDTGELAEQSIAVDPGAVPHYPYQDPKRPAGAVDAEDGATELTEEELYAASG